MKGIKFLIDIIFSIPGDQQKPDTDGKWKTLPEILSGPKDPKETPNEVTPNDWGDVKVDGGSLKNGPTGDFPKDFGKDNENTA
jgi:hypothetical protein